MSANLSPDMSQLSSAFDGANLKIERAKRHINEFKAIVDGFNSVDAQGLAVARDPKGREVLNFRSLGPEVQQLPLVIGDAAHNLRAALDHIWAGFHRSISSSASKPPGFPFHETRKNVEDLVAKSPVKMTFPKTERLVLEEVKPYSDAGGNRVLWALTKIDNLDKHNLLIPTLVVNRVNNLIIRTGGATIRFKNCSFTNIETIMGSDAPIKQEQQGSIAVTPEFRDRETHLAGEPVLPTLVYLADAVAKTLDLFRKTFSA